MENIFISNIENPNIIIDLSKCTKISTYVNHSDKSYYLYFYFIDDSFYFKFSSEEKLNSYFEQIRNLLSVIIIDPNQNQITL